MADQTVKLVGDGTAERVAYDLAMKIMFTEKSSNYATKQQIIDLYVDCLWAVASRSRTGDR